MDKDIKEFISKYPPMKEALDNGKDAYATYASLIFNKDYKDCLEFDVDTHEPKPCGQERRRFAKTFVLIAFLIHKGYPIEYALQYAENLTYRYFEGDKDESNS